MHKKGLANFFLAGYQKSGSTWLHRCFAEHPDIFVPEKDAIHFFTIHYHKGLEWYERFFESFNGEDMVGDTTPSYIRFTWSRQRLFDFNPYAKILITLRNPINRAFSHYWHEKKKRSINYNFVDIFGNNVDIFDSWIATGFYYDHINELLKLFPRKQIQVMFYEDLVVDPKAFCREVFDFLNVNPDFVPSIIDKRINKAWFKPTYLERLLNILKGRSMDQSEFDRGLDTKVRDELRTIYRPEIQKLETLLNRDLSFWE